MTKPTQSSTGGDALQEQIEKLPTYPYDTWEGKVLVSRSDVLALLAPPLIKQEAETPSDSQLERARRLVEYVKDSCICWAFHNITMDKYFYCGECSNSISTLGWPSAEKIVHKEDCIFHVAAEFAASGQAEQEVVAPVGEETLDDQITLTVRGTKDIAGVMDALRKAGYKSEKEIVVATNLASSVSGPSEGLREAVLQARIEEATKYAIRYWGEPSFSQRHKVTANPSEYAEWDEEFIEEMKRIAELEATLAQSAAGTSRQEDFSIPAKEDL